MQGVKSEFPEEEVNDVTWITRKVMQELLCLRWISCRVECVVGQRQKSRERKWKQEGSLGRRKLKVQSHELEHSILETIHHLLSGIPDTADKGFGKGSSPERS